MRFAGVPSTRTRVPSEASPVANRTLLGRPEYVSDDRHNFFKLVPIRDARGFRLSGGALFACPVEFSFDQCSQHD